MPCSCLLLKCGKTENVRGLREGWPEGERLTNNWRVVGSTGRRVSYQLASGRRLVIDVKCPVRLLDTLVDSVTLLRVHDQAQSVPRLRG